METRERGGDRTSCPDTSGNWFGQVYDRCNLPEPVLKRVSAKGRDAQHDAVRGDAQVVLEVAVTFLAPPSPSSPWSSRSSSLLLLLCVVVVVVVVVVVAVIVVVGIAVVVVVDVMSLRLLLLVVATPHECKLRGQVFAAFAVVAVTPSQPNTRPPRVRGTVQVTLQHTLTKHYSFKSNAVHATHANATQTQRTQISSNATHVLTCQHTRAMHDALTHNTHARNARTQRTARAPNTPRTPRTQRAHVTRRTYAAAMARRQPFSDGQ